MTDLEVGRFALKTFRIQKDLVTSVYTPVVAYWSCYSSTVIEMAFKSAEPFADPVEMAVAYGLKTGRTPIDYRDKSSWGWPDLEGHNYDQ